MDPDTKRFIAILSLVVLILGGSIFAIMSCHACDTSSSECKRYAQAMNYDCIPLLSVEGAAAGDNICYCPSEDGTKIWFKVPVFVRNQYRSGKSGEGVIYPRRRRR